MSQPPEIALVIGCQRKRPPGTQDVLCTLYCTVLLYSVQLEPSYPSRPSIRSTGCASPIAAAAQLPASIPCRDRVLTNDNVACFTSLAEEDCCFAAQWQDEGGRGGSEGSQALAMQPRRAACPFSMYGCRHVHTVHTVHAVFVHAITAHTHSGKVLQKAAQAVQVAPVA